MYLLNYLLKLEGGYQSNYLNEPLIFTDKIPKGVQKIKSCRVAIGVTKDGDREIICFMIQNDDSNDMWSKVFDYLKERGL